MDKPTNLLAVKATLLLVSTLTVMSNATITPSLPVMQEHFNNVDNVDYWVRLVLTAPSLFVAITNAIYHATGKRIRDLPITPDKLL